MRYGINKVHSKTTVESGVKFIFMKQFLKYKSAEYNVFLNKPIKMKSQLLLLFHSNKLSNKINVVQIINEFQKLDFS